MPDDEADYLEDDENVLIEEKFFENGKCRLYDLGGEEDSDEYVCQCQIITEHQFTLFTLSCEGKDEAMGFSADFIDHCYRFGHTRQAFSIITGKCYQKG